MAGAKKSGDKWANIAAVKLTEVAAGTIAYAKFAFPFSIMDKVGIVISRLEYWFGVFSTLESTEDAIITGLISANAISDPGDQSDSSLLDSVKLTRVDHGTAGSAVLVTLPIIKDFSYLPGGGILTAPAPLSAFIKSYSTTGTTTAWLKLFYTYINLTTDEYWEMVESRRVITT